MNQVIFEEKLEPWRKYLGIIYACYCSFGGSLLVLALHSVFGQLDYSLFNLFTRIIFPITAFAIYVPTVFKPLKKQKPKKIIIWFALGILMALSVKITLRFFENNLIYYLGYEGLKNFNTEQMGNQLNTNGFLKIFLMISICVIGPFIEEVTYRVCVFGTLRKKNAFLAHLITALLFAFQHISTAVILYNRPQEFLFIFSYMGFSLVMTFLYEKTKTPVPGILTHMALNFIM